MTKVETFDDSLLRATAETALAAITGAKDRAPALIEAWVSQKNAAAVAEVAERGAGPARKAARRALNVLRSRGVAIPERARVATLAKPSDVIVEAFLLAPDAAGTELFAVCSRTATSRGRAVLVFLNPRGVLRVGSDTFSQSQLKEHLSGLAPGKAYAPVRVPVEWARARIAEARKRHTERGVPEPMGFASNRDLLEPAPDAVPPHPFDEEGFELADDDAFEMAKKAVDLHRIPEFRGWFPSQQAFEELLFNVGQKLPPGEQPSSDVLSQVFKEEIDAATDRYFNPEVRAELVSLMKDSALSVLAREGEPRALELAAVMKAIEKRGLVTDPPRDIPFLRGFFEKALSVAAMQSGGRLNIPVRRAVDTGAEAQPAEASAEAAPAEPEPPAP